jgi:hypothetical protein
MSSVIAPRVVLVPHPTTLSDAIQSVDVQVRAAETGTLALEYSLHADLKRLRIPPEGPIRRADELWRHTCFEAFLNFGGSQGYCELNFSPAGQWAAYRFDAYRSGMAPAELSRPPSISVRWSPKQLQLEAVMHLPPALAPGAARPARLALSAVIEEDSGRLCYWAARHPDGRPDFHHPDGFTLETP